MIEDGKVDTKGLQGTGDERWDFVFVIVRVLGTEGVR